MFTLVYLNGNFNRPDTLPSFLHANVGKKPLLQLDCVTPFQGTANELVDKVCEHLNTIDPQMVVTCDDIKNASTDTISDKTLVHFMVVQILISKLC